MMPWIRKIALVIVIALAGFTAGADAQESGIKLPDMGASASRMFSPQEEAEFVRELTRYFRANDLLVEDPLIHGYLEDMGYRLVSHSDQASRNFHFHVVKAPEVNAFAAPGGFIAAYAGLILAANTEDELAGVMAHEVAHVTQNHIARSMESGQNTSMPVMLATLGLAVVAGLAGAGGDVGQALIAGGAGISQQMQINYTRQNEYEADRVGLGLMARAGYDPEGLINMFHTFNTLSRARGAGPPEYLRTHPLSTTRIAEAQSRVQGMTPRDNEKTPDFYLIQARLRSMIERPSRAEQYFRTRLDQERGPFPEAHRYGLALSLIRRSEYEEAARIVEDLLDTHGPNQMFRLLDADLKLAQGQVAEAVDLLAEMHRDYGGSRVIAKAYSEALLYEDNAERARTAADLIRRELRGNRDDAQLHALLAKAAARAGDPVRSGEAVAETHYLRGNLPEAIVHLERLIRREDLDFYQRSRVDARLSEMQAERSHLSRRDRG